QMQAIADQLAAKEEEFNKWQEKLVEQTRREHEVLTEEMNVERDHFKERINQLEDALNLANLEISRLTIELADINDMQKKGRRGSSCTSGSSSSMEIPFGEKKRDDRDELTKQILEITQRRISIQTELTLLEETNEELKNQYTQITKENQMLRRENDNLKQQLGKQLFAKSLEDINLTD
ncbi:7090_t:CDS:2, partial [Acaulospora morrowiae]